MLYNFLKACISGQPFLNPLVLSEFLVEESWDGEEEKEIREERVSRVGIY